MMLNADVALLNRLRSLYRQINDGTLSPTMIKVELGFMIEALEERQLPTWDYSFPQSTSPVQQKPE